jgi:hypothetical protein
MAGRRIPEWVNNRIKQLAIEIRENLGSLRYPTAPEVLSALRDSGELAQGYLPSARHVQKVLGSLKLPAISDIDAPWSLGKSDEYRIPDAATGAILAVWSWAMLHPAADTLSIRTARWVSKLRWVPNAGGSPLGKAKDPEKLYQFASLYSGRERQVELIKDKKGMRSGVLDAHLMLEPSVRRLIKRLGLIEDDAGITYSEDEQKEDFTKVAPSYYKYLQAQQNLDPEVVKEKAHALGLAELGEAKEVVTTLLGMAIKKLTSDSRHRTFGADQKATCLYRLQIHLHRTYKAGDIDSWEPPIEEILQEVSSY